MKLERFYTALSVCKVFDGVPLKGIREEQNVCSSV